MPKNIVLLSDGTGNSAGKLFKTNVWRVYDALDLRDPAVQVACYDDGVGTSAFMPVALLGGAVGFGLKRNVLRLYRFLCEQYEPGDRIYAFGFSRGAFTIRVLVALIAAQGIIRVRAHTPADRPPADPAAALEDEAGVAVATARTAITGSELRRLSRRAYQQFRHEFDQSLPTVAAARRLRDALCRARDVRRGRRAYDAARNHQLGEHDIAFVGLWDTVDAYGLPIDELTHGVDKWIWPLSFPELQLSRKVEKACHALSLDDERHTFHPVLWDESEEPQDKRHLDEERISQVWFAGVHANVGGGYPNDALSAVSLDWIAHEARKTGLRFLDQALARITEKRDPLGAAYDSRRGLAGYYRYNPRKLRFLTNGQVHERAFVGGRWPVPSPTVTIARPKIHESVFRRIAAAPDFYAPIGLPETYAVVTANGRILSRDEYGFETAAEARARAHAQEVAWDLVWWRRVDYFAAVGVSLALLIWPTREGAGEIASVGARGGASDIVALVGGLLPEMASPWVDYYAARPAELTAGAAALGVIMLIGRRLRARIGDCMHRIWRYVITPSPAPDMALPAPRGLLYHARQHPYYHGAFAVFRRMVLPNVFGLLVLVCLLAGANRAIFEGLSVTGAICQSGGAARPVPAEGAIAARFDTASFCQPTGVLIESGVDYELRAAFAGASDGGIAVPDGPDMGEHGFGVLSPELTGAQQAMFAAFSPFKRLWRANWFAPVARIGESGVEQVPLHRATTRFTARNDGELFLFVNDAIAPLAYVRGLGGRAGWSASYRNNTGAGTITIRRVADQRLPE